VTKKTQLVLLVVKNHYQIQRLNQRMKKMVYHQRRKLVRPLVRRKPVRLQQRLLLKHQQRVRASKWMHQCTIYIAASYTIAINTIVL